MLEVAGLSYDYPGTRALDDVSFAIAKGSITALVGPNGAGKTTLMRCVAALDRPFSGKVLLDGLDVHADPRAAHRRIGYLSDFFGLYDRLSVRQCLTYFARAQGLGADCEAAVMTTVEAIGLRDRLESPAETLSRGMRQRLAIGQAMIHLPDLLILDEPASGLDPEARQDLSTLLLALRDRGLTIVVSSHILAELAEYSTHMLVMDGGRVLQHEALDSVGSVDGVSLELELATELDDSSMQDLIARLDALPKVRGCALAGAGLRFQFLGDRGARHQLLRDLIESGVPVCGFATRRRNLQDAYLDRISTARSAGGDIHDR